MPTGCASAWSIPATGDPVQVVCGAPNARTGMKGVFVPPGAYIPGKDITLAVGTIRGVESRGMLVSEVRAANLRRPRRHHRSAGRCAGRRELRPICRARRSGDRDQSDAEPAGLHRRARHRPRSCRRRHGQVQGCGHQAGQGRVSLPGRGARSTAPELCPAFALRLVRGVKNGPSPAWLQKRLTAIGLRPINALVDITNFITYDRGRPLHVFDAAKVHGNLTVRRAQRRRRRCWRSTARPTRSTTASASSPTRTASNRSPASWAAKQPAARKPPPTC